MKKQVVWLVVSSWMVAALLLTSCAPAVVKEEAEKVAPPVKEKEVVAPKEVVVPEKKGEWVKWRGTKLDGTVVERMLEKPRYGGTHVTVGRVQPTTFDDVTRHGGDNWAVGPVQESLLINDWTRGPQGTSDWSPQLQMIITPNTFETGLLAERWELADPDTLVYHIRKGVHWALDPTSEASRLVGGREFTADDVVFNSIRNWTIGYWAKNRPFLTDMKNVANSIYVSPTDKWAVVFKIQPGHAGDILRGSYAGRNKMFVPEVIAKYGEITSGKWRQVVGTGPFILKEYVPASSLTYVRNPNYWGNDPFFPENQIPYLDGVKLLIIPDLSTQMAALRTGKIDNLPTGGAGGTIDITREMASSLWKTNPELQWVSHYGAGAGLSIAMRVDTKPFDDIRVRRALHMAINNQEILDQYYGGEADMFTYPVQPVPENALIYTPLEKMPRSVQELYEYHPDKAKQLLGEAGYPQGFKAEIITTVAEVDLLSIIKEYWAKIGVDLKIEVRDDTVFASIQRRKTHTQMITASAGGGFGMLTSSNERKGGASNYSMIDDPWHPIQWAKDIENLFNPAKKTIAYTEPMAEGLPSWVVYANEQSWYIELPIPKLYVFWQPWLKGYYGTNYIGYALGLDWSRYAWIDQDLKKAMGR